MGADNNHVIARLTQAAAGLLYLSESDYPFELIQWDGPTEPTPEFIRNAAGEPEGSPIQMLEVDQFLNSGRYQRLLLALQHELSDLRAYKVGRINMPVYVVGLSREGSWLGVATRVVET
jgi:hypothetical protein